MTLQLKKLSSQILIFGLLGFALLTHAFAEEELLAPEKAFAFSAKIAADNTITANWDIAKGYYLYRKKFKFSTKTAGVSLGEPVYPKGKIKDDEFFGKVEIYRKHVAVKIPVNNTANAKEIKLDVTSQGCADLGVCYPPYKQNADLTLTAAVASIKNSTENKTAVGGLKDLSSSLGLNAGFGNQQDEVLDPDVAFQFNAEQVDGNTVKATWQIAKDHYMYRDKFIFEIIDGAGVVVGKAALPPGETKHDQFFGELKVFHNFVSATIPLGAKKDSAAKLRITYQGCAEITGICYPPIKKVVDVNVKAGGVTAAASGATPIPAPMPAAGNTSTPSETKFVSQQDKSTMVLASKDMLQIVIFFFLGGLALAFTACMYPMIPILSSIIVGHGENITTKKAFGLSLLYVESMAITFAIMGGLVAAFAGGINLQASFQSPWILIPFSILFVALAFSMFGFYNIQMPASLQGKLSQLSNNQKGGSLIGVAIMGVLSALIIGPCAGPVVIGALAFAAKEGDIIHGFIAMLVLGNGLGLPLLIVGTSGGKLLPKAGTWMDIVKYGAGVILLAIALLFLERISFMPAVAIMSLWAVLLITVGVYLGALEPIKDGASGWRKLWKGLGLVAMLYGAIVMLGGLTGARNFNDPLHGSKLLGGGGGSTQAHTETSFKRIKTVSDLKREIAAAKAQGKYVMLDFYADWCTYCKTFEDYVFSDPKVQNLLKDFVLLQADVTKYDDKDKALQKYTSVIAPPAILFYKPDGIESRQYRIVGAMNAKQFIDRVNKVIK